MREAPSLYTLCLDSIKDMILYGDDLSCLYQLPTEIIDCLIPQLQKFQDAFQRKRKRCDNFETAWMTLYKNEWQELYWNSHIQKCLSVAAEKAVLPYFEGCLGEIKIPDSILLSTGYKQRGSYLEVDYSKLAYHCQHFGLYARYLTLKNVLLQTETSVSGTAKKSLLLHLFLYATFLRNSKLEALVVQWIKSKEQLKECANF
ncbi:hypothetical protein POM88_027833 [Heracleum sosnowskyi]|uniref:Uncharacterized protein n=1 Tax=Heracleum sosnowskyi TaxID=360622 RepID=A0AAD8I9Q4_9APIA|nr:hypothetical protein POM88_027833 [Heracleum sosnowskyi]